MESINIKVGFCVFLVLGCLLANTGFTQSITVIGGNESAQECYNNAQFSELPGALSRSVLEPCDYALEYVSLDTRDRVATLTNRGILRYKLQDFAGAMSDLERAQGLRPEMPEIYINTGNVLYMMSEYSGAIDNYMRALNLGISQDYAAHVNLGMSYERLGNFSMAQESYATALELRPGWDLARRLLSNLQITISEAAGQTP